MSGHRVREHLECIRNASDAYWAASLTAGSDNAVVQAVNDYNNECGAGWLEYAWSKVDADFARGGRS